MKRYLLFATASLLFIGCDPSTQETEAKKTQAKQLVEGVHADLRAGLGDSADLKMTRALALFPEKEDPMNGELNALSFDLVRARSDDFRDKALGKLTAKAVVALKKGDNITYFDDADANGFFLKRLKARSPQWSTLHNSSLRDQTAQRTADAQTKNQAALMLANGRRTYAAVLRDNFLDGGLDINVAVSGKNATYLKLQYALFGAVWGRKFETEGLFNKFREMGFSKVELTDGYDYDYVWTL